MRPIDGLQRKCFTLGGLSLPSQSHAAMTAMGRLSLFDAATEPPPSLRPPTLAAKAHCGRNPRPRPITCAQCEIAPLSPPLPQLLVCWEVMSPTAAIPTLPQGDDVPPLPTSAASAVRRCHSTSATIASLPPSASRRHVHDARTRGTGSKDRSYQQSRDSTDIFSGLRAHSDFRGHFSIHKKFTILQ